MSVGPPSQEFGEQPFAPRHGDSSAQRQSWAPFTLSSEQRDVARSNFQKLLSSLDAEFDSFCKRDEQLTNENHQLRRLLGRYFPSGVSFPDPEPELQQSSRSRTNKASDQEVVPDSPTESTHYTQGHGRRASSTSALSSVPTVQPTLSSGIVVLSVWTEDWIAGRCTGDMIVSESRFQRFVVTPTCKMSVGWDLVATLCMVYEMIELPMHAFALGEVLFLRVMHIVVSVLWTLDLLFSFVRGYEKDGVVMLRPKRVALHYLKTWFLLDAVIVATDWAFYLISRGAVSSFLRVLRLIRVARIMKLASRLFCTQWAVGGVVGTESKLAALSILGLLVSLAYILHVVSCGWYAIGSMSVFERSWKDNAFTDDQRLGYRYTTAYHWSMTQFTPASMEISPVNTHERIYTIVMIFLGLLVFSTLISTITNISNNLRQENLQRKAGEALMQRYIAENRLSLGLANCILGHLRRAHRGKRKRLREEQIPAMQLLPENVRTRIRSEVYASRLMLHPVFRRIKDIDFSMHVLLCSRAMAEKDHVQGDPIFCLFDQGIALRLITRGYAEYESSLEGGLVHVSAGQWITEAVLWLDWDHAGHLTATSWVELVEVNASSVHNIVVEDCNLKATLQKYAKVFASRAMKELRSGYRISDTWPNSSVQEEFARRAFRERDVDKFREDKLTLLRMMEHSDGEGMQRLIFKEWAKLSKRDDALTDGGLEEDCFGRAFDNSSFQGICSVRALRARLGHGHKVPELMLTF
eukprot:CAMPEP_0170575912 /NCGR_PEP_ID=MMETSP0224-20130122/4115_1 /TAXON_ID=285029 /ORGANISM="Togula jolla, Strain CCCM 725" /LENGTH=750 /DNA_ID=CAMNT_0010898725 /DNA_START=188 /DNA_END=2438 /DNA_ORIENTATION=+